jgi:hypothetical protein
LCGSRAIRLEISRSKKKACPEAVRLLQGILFIRIYPKASAPINFRSTLGDSMGPVVSPMCIIVINCIGKAERKALFSLRRENGKIEKGKP